MKDILTRWAFAMGLTSFLFIVIYPSFEYPTHLLFPLSSIVLGVLAAVYGGKGAAVFGVIGAISSFGLLTLMGLGG